ncbi:MAG: monovalent cation/H(+) antiporter subunit G [Nitrospirota bacterium]|nr:monovalent cation/H(+) antiporter subunit G [Nitrospirota bacterium]
MSTVAIFLMIAGVFFFTTATIGLLRFPDCYTRMHAAGKGDTLGALLLLLGLALYNLNDGFSLAALLVSLKILSIAVFIFVANPTASHAIAKAAIDAGVRPWTRKGGKP